MSSSISLIHLPDVPMEIIFNELDFVSILILRKVCRSLRNSIDYLKPASDTNGIKVIVKPNAITFNCCFDNAVKLFGQEICVTYEKRKNGCSVVCKKKKKFMRKDDFMTIFCKDMEIVMRHQKKLLQYFYLDFECDTIDHIFKNFKKILESSKNLHIKQVHIRTSDQRQIMSMLPYINPQSLDNIGLIGDISERLELDEVIKLDQWKQAKVFTAVWPIVSVPIQHFTHFLRAEILFETVTLEDIIVLIEAFLQNVNFKSFKLCYMKIEDEQCLIDAFGPPYIEDESYIKRKKWFFRTTDNLRDLSVFLYKRYISFFTS